MSRRRPAPAYAGSRRPRERRLPYREPEGLGDLAEDVARVAVDPLVAEARRARCAPPLAAVFVDPVTGERIAYADHECDTRGTPLMGVDDDRTWVGTARAVLVLAAGACRYFALDGMMGAQDWAGYVLAHTEDDARAYAASLGVVLHVVEPIAYDDVDDDDADLTRRFELYDGEVDPW